MFSFFEPTAAPRVARSGTPGRGRWRGHLWQGRFASYVLDEPYLLAAARYVEMNPVKAGLVRSPQQYRWSSAGAQLRGEDDRLAHVGPLLEFAGDWKKFLSHPVEPLCVEKLQLHERTGRPLGSERFLAKLEKRLDRVLRPRRPGRNPKHPHPNRGPGK